MPESVRYAGWELAYSIPDLANGGLRISDARFRGVPVLAEGSQPFSHTMYHDASGRPPRPTVFKDGLGHDSCRGGARGTGSPYRAVRASSPDEALEIQTHTYWATNDRAWSADQNPSGGVVVEQLPASQILPQRLVVWAKVAMWNYQFIHRWEFSADGSISVQVGLGGRLNIVEHGIHQHIHNFFFRLDFDLGRGSGGSGNRVQRFDHPGWGPHADHWTEIVNEQVEVAGNYTKWRVLDGAPKANGHFRSYELIPGSEGPPDGLFSTADFWVTRYASLEDGSDVGCDDSVLSTRYVQPNVSVAGEDVVLWHSLRVHHEARPDGEERQAVPYRFVGFRLEPRDFLDDTVKRLYATNPPSPIGPAPPEWGGTGTPR